MNKLKKMIKLPVYWIRLFESIWIFFFVFTSLGVLKQFSSSSAGYLVVFVLTMFFLFDLCFDPVFYRCYVGGDSDGSDEIEEKDQ